MKERVSDKEGKSSMLRLIGTGKEQLSPREKTILHGLLEGLTDGEIAARLGLSEKTVNTHMRHLTAKLGAKNRTHAVVQALRGNLLRLDAAE